MTQEGERLSCDLVVTAGGRRSLAPKWLQEIGSGLAANHDPPSPATCTTSLATIA